jgi:hypothetical protein
MTLFCFLPCFFPFFPLYFDLSLLSKKIPLFFNSQDTPPSSFLWCPPLVFISRGGEGHLTPAMTQGKVGWGAARKAWLP